MKTSELLIQAKALINTEDKWTQHSYARNAYDDEVRFESSEACKFCSLGALNRTIYDTDEVEKELKCVHYLADAVKNKIGEELSIPAANDALSHYNMMQIWDIAIELAQKDERQFQTHQG